MTDYWFRLGVVLAGYIAMILGGWFGELGSSRGRRRCVGQLLATLFFLADFVAVLAGVIGLVYKVIADANAASQA